MFELKKIQIETLSEYLKVVRADLNLTAEYVAATINIKPKFLSALESGDYRNLPPDVYVLGFLKQLAELYSVDQQSLIEQYKKEKIIQRQLQERHAVPSSPLGKIFSKLIITPRLLSLLVGAVFILATVLYIVWQVVSINQVPNLEITSPQDRQIIKESFVVVKGLTDPGINLTVNAQDVFVDREGKFSIQLGVSSGPKDLVVTAKNKFDKLVTKTISIVGESVPQQNSESRVDLKMEFAGDVMLGFSIDDQATQTMNFHDGETKILTGTQKILISTSDAGLTKVTLNGQSLGILGRAGEKLSGIPFFAESVNIK